MSWVHIPAVTLRQARTFIDSVALSVQWEFKLFKIVGSYYYEVTRKAGFYRWPILSVLT